MDNPEKLATLETQDEDKQKKTQHNICSTPPYTNKQKHPNVASFSGLSILWFL
jgi:hypothetical protein